LYQSNARNGSIQKSCKAAQFQLVPDAGSTLDNLYTYIMQRVAQLEV